MERSLLTVLNSNQADLLLLETIGINPDITIREKRPTLRTAGFAVIAAIRMQKMKKAWEGNRRVQEQLLRKLEQGRRARKGVK